MYDYLIVSAGLWRPSSYMKLQNDGEKKIKVIDNRINSDIYCENEDINVHKYGAHIFHTLTKKCGTEPIRWIH